MNLTQVLKNSAWHFTAKAVGLVIGLVTLALTTRYLGQNGYGQYATAFAWVQFAGILVDFGLYMVLLAELGKTTEKLTQEKIIGNVLSLRIFSALGVFILAIGIAWLMPYSMVIKLAITILAIAFFCQSINQILTALFQYQQKMQQGSLVEVIGKGLALIFLLVIISQNLGLLWIVSTITLANIINTFIIWLLASRLFHIKLQIDLGYWKKILPLAWPLAIIGIFNIFYFKADTLILSWFQPLADVGLYSAPYRLLEVVISLPPLFLGLILPGLARDWQDNKETIKQSLQKSLHFFHLLVIPMLVGTLLLAKPIMIFIAGADFAQSGQILQLLIIATAFIFYAQLFSYTIVAAGMQKQILKTIMLASIIAIIGYIVFIPLYSYFAAAIITILVEAFVMLAYLKLIKKHIAFSFFDKHFLKILFSASVMGMAIYAFSYLPIMLVILLGGIVYVLSIFLTRSIKSVS